MLEFDSGVVESLSSEQAHAELVDAWLGMDVQSCESKILSQVKELYPHEQTWAHVGPRVFQTPYKELRRLCEHLAPPSGSTFADLGAGYGRLGFVLKEFYPKVNFLGFELVAERVKVARLAYERRYQTLMPLHCTSLGGPDFVVPPADFYFIYDFGRQQAIDKTLEDLRSIGVAVVG